MKKLVYLLFSVVLAAGSINASNAQSFITASGVNDTVTEFQHNNENSVDVSNSLKSTSGSVYIKWTVMAVATAGNDSIQFCDNYYCTTAPVVGETHVSHAYANNAFGAFHATFTGLSHAPSNSISYITILAEDTNSHTSRKLTFRVNKPSLSINNTVAADNDVTLYPNPAREAVNVTYSPAAGVKTIAVYNLIGKAVKIFRPMDDNGAKLDIDNIPTGVYFVRLMDGNGHVVATRRFTRQ